MEQDKFVINIGRQLGSGGKAVGEAVARRLGIGVYDKQLINLAAEQSGLCPEVFERVDEKESRNLFRRSSPICARRRRKRICREQRAQQRRPVKIQSDVIRDIAARESCVSSAAVPTTSCGTASPSASWFTPIWRAS